METKTHYRKVFKSDHLGVADLEDFIEEKKSLIQTISHVKQEINVSVAGKKGDFNIAYFKSNIKPLVLNATNSAVMKQLTGSVFIEDWKNVNVELFVERNIRFGRDVVDGVRIKKVAKELPILTEKHEKFNAIKQALKNGNTIEQVRQKYQVSNEIEQKLYETV